MTREELTLRLEYIEDEVEYWAKEHTSPRIAQLHLLKAIALAITTLGYILLHTKDTD